MWREIPGGPLPQRTPSFTAPVLDKPGKTS
jgi:hypothetical protein